MNKFAIGLAAALAIGTAAPAFAHEPGEHQQGASDWNGGSQYGEFSDDVAHIQEGIQHGMSDGSYSRYQVRQFQRELRNLQRMIMQYNYSGGFSPWEQQMIHARLERLHTIMHVVHDQAHDEQDGSGGYGGGYGGYRGGYGGGYRR